MAEVDKAPVVSATFTDMIFANGAAPTTPTVFCAAATMPATCVP